MKVGQEVFTNWTKLGAMSSITEDRIDKLNFISYFHQKKRIFLSFLKNSCTGSLKWAIDGIPRYEDIWENMKKWNIWMHKILVNFYKYTDIHSLLYKNDEISCLLYKTSCCFMPHMNWKSGKINKVDVRQWCRTFIDMSLDIKFDEIPLCSNLCIGFCSK